MSNDPKKVDLGHYLASVTGAEREIQRLYPKDASLTICDIGACEGEDSIRFSRLYPSACIYAFEPLPTNQKIIGSNFSEYKVTNATLVPLALSNADGEAVFHVSSGRPPELFAGENWNYGNKSSSLLPPATNDPMHGWIKFDTEITVKTQTLDRFCAEHHIRHLDYIHMDVQGAEKLVLEGATEMLPNITAIWLEVSRKELYLGQPVDSEIAEFMKKHGFSLVHSTYLADHVEGDHFYLNLHHLRTWPYIINQLGRRFYRQIKRTLSS